MIQVDPVTNIPIQTDPRMAPRITKSPSRAIKPNATIATAIAGVELVSGSGTKIEAQNAVRNSATKRSIDLLVKKDKRG